MRVSAADLRQVVEGDAAADPPASVVQTFDGQHLRIAYREDVVMDLAKGAAVARRIEPALSDLEGRPLSEAERGKLLASDMERIDTHTLERGLARAAQRVDGEPATLILAVSYLTAASQRARSRLLSRSTDELSALRRSAIWLLTDLPAQAPNGRVAEVAALLKPYGRAVFGKARLSLATLKALKGAGLSGLVIEPALPPTTAVDGALWLLQAGKMVEKSAPALVALDVPTADLFEMAREAGFTHAVLA